MIINYKGWRRLFLFCLGLSLGTAFCMKWIEEEFIVGGHPFTMIGLEIFYPKDRVFAILSGLDEHVKILLRTQLIFDFLFMAGIYPGIAALCMMAKEKLTNRSFKKALWILAFLQLPAWGCDVFENSRLLKWINEPGSISGFGFYHFIVATKWILALSAALVGIPLALKKRKA